MRKLIFLMALLVSLITVAETVVQGIPVSGIVLDEQGVGLPGATVVIKGTANGVITDIDGNFTITVPDKDAVLLFSFVGYETQEVVVGAQTVLSVRMDNNINLNEVVVVGFGTQKRANATGAVKTIDNAALDSRPITSVADGLQGVIAGLNITNDLGGAPGQQMDINIRGLGTINEGSSSSPLVLIDGMEGDLSSFNPNDIENISVLKDAASAAIYGSRAPFGVILVTTRSGSRKKEVTYSSSLRLGTPIYVPKPLDSYDYALMVNDAFVNSGESAQFGAAQLDKILRYQNGELPFGTEEHPTQNQWLKGQQSFGNTNWYDVHLKNQVTSYEHNLNLSGGGDQVVYYFSANYLKQNGMFTYADDYFSRFSINGRVNVKILENLSMNWNTRLVTTENSRPSAMNDLFFHNLGRRAAYIPLYLPNGEYNPESLVPSLLNGSSGATKPIAVQSGTVYLRTRYQLEVLY